jgi:hypothetical protein
MGDLVTAQRNISFATSSLHFDVQAHVTTLTPDIELTIRVSAGRDMMGGLEPEAYFDYQFITYS